MDFVNAWIDIKSVSAVQSMTVINSASKSLPSFFRWFLKKKNTANGEEACQDDQVQVCLHGCLLSLISVEAIARFFLDKTFRISASRFSSSSLCTAIPSSSSSFTKCGRTGQHPSPQGWQTSLTLFKPCLFFFEVKRFRAKKWALFCFWDFCPYRRVLMGLTDRR